MQTNIPSSSMKIKLRRNITGKKLTIGIIAMKSSLKNNIPWFLLSGTPSTAKNLFWGDWCKVEQGSGAKFVIGEVLTASLVKNIISYLEKNLLCKYDGILFERLSYQTAFLLLTSVAISSDRVRLFPKFCWKVIRLSAAKCKIERAVIIMWVSIVIGTIRSFCFLIDKISSKNLTSIVYV